MYNDLTQIAKAEGIYRTLAISSILSNKLAADKNGKYSQQGKSYTKDEQLYVEDTIIKDKCTAIPGRRDSYVG